MRGTWQTADHPGGHLAFLAVLAAVLLGSGAAAAVASAIVTIVIIAGALLGLAVVALAVLVALRVRREHQAAPPTLLRQLPAAEAPAVAPTGPRELHQHVHHHYGADPATVAEILRRAQRPE